MTFWEQLIIKLFSHLRCAARMYFLTQPAVSSFYARSWSLFQTILQTFHKCGNLSSLLTIRKKSNFPMLNYSFKTSVFD